MNRRPVRVAMVAASPRIVGGHSVQAESLTACLERDGVIVDRVAIDRSLPRAIRRVPGLRTCVNEVCYAAALTAARRADVVHAFSASYWSFLLAPVPAMLAGRLAGARVVLHYHSGELADHLANWGWRVHPWLALADEIVVCSEFQRRVFEAHGYRARVIPNIVDVSRFAWRSRQPLTPRFVCTRNLESHYGVDVVLDAFARIRARHPGATLTVVGGGSCERSLKAHAARLGAEGITFAGSVSPARMPDVLDRADILLNGSSIDNQPVSIIEAQASGLSVVSTDVGGIADIVVHQRAGLLVPVGDSRAMAEAACALLREPAWAAEMALHGRSGTGRFTWDAVRTAWLRAYGPAAAGRMAGSRFERAHASEGA